MELDLKWEETQPLTCKRVRGNRNLYILAHSFLRERTVERADSTRHDDDYYKGRRSYNKRHRSRRCIIKNNDLLFYRIIVSVRVKKKNWRGMQKCKKLCAYLKIWMSNWLGIKICFNYIEREHQNIFLRKEYEQSPFSRIQALPIDHVHASIISLGDRWTCTW